MIWERIEVLIAAAVGAAVSVYRKNDAPMLSKLCIGAISFGLAYVCSEALTEQYGMNEKFWAAVIGSFGFMVIEIVAAVLEDRGLFVDLIKGQIKERLGKK